ncbi:SDR family oxidoreductase [Sphingobacterium griseoflavum]|uniref:NAD(P)-dependent oxidoreductase n=1 Tax=Sphingobacterium griseoflavum TaxID=1474952 RepID=A0ABQ3HUE7_9SPHI|nr:SDR family oxidoreductase [Sphingobacterium griseoflavum]GHE23432.1 NAD(P)-dependent oxidoreductase [Sphingobacterium griseoflavum]
MKIGITGATGQLGRLVVDKLKERIESTDIVALVRNVEKAADLGIEARPFDYSRPQELSLALNGIEKLLLISGNEIGQRESQHANVIAAAKESGIKHIFYTSLLHADRSKLSLAPEHLATEEALKKSGISYTILRNGWYTENYTGSISGSLAAGAFIGSAGDGRISSASRLDFAEAAAIVLTSENQEGRTYELAGDHAYTLSDLAAELTAQSGKEIPYKNFSENDYAEVLKTFGVPNAFAHTIASWDACAEKGDLFDQGKELSRLLGRPTTPLAETVKETLASI